MNHPDTPIAADRISYASSGKTRAGRALIRTIENVTGRRAILKRARDRGIAADADFWAAMVDLFALRLKIVWGSLDHIPPGGPLVIVSNHPYGILDGLFMGYILSLARPDFRIMAHRIFGVAPQIADVILPISFDGTPEALALNLETRKTAIDYLRGGGAIGIFPGGTVSTSRRPFGPPADPGWRSFAAKMITRADATIVPIYFEGQNSRLFQIASHLNYTLRVALLINEFRRRIESDVRISIGTPISVADLGAVARNGHDLMHELRRRTYALSPNGSGAFDYGFEFEATHRRDRTRHA